MTRVLFVTSEVFPLIKTGGLADVSASLPAALRGLGIDVQILLPGYPPALAAARKTRARRHARLRVGSCDVSLWKSRLPDSDVPLWLVDCAPFFGRAGNPYTNEEGLDWWDNAQRYHLFARVAAMMAGGQAGLAWVPDVIHCNDWQTGLVPALLEASQDRPATVFTIHNLAYQGLFPYQTFLELNLPDWLWRWDQLEFHGQLSFIKGGLVFSDRITTVSPGYAVEIQTPAFGNGLDGLLRHRHDRLQGILNGIDARVWNPEQDPEIPCHYGSRDLQGKAQCKSALQRDQSLEPGNAPLLGFIGRLVEQKGVDWLISVLPALLDRGCQFVLLGSGEARYEEPLKQLAEQWPGRLSLTLGYDEGLSHRITAGCDLFLMPSRFEPCGLNQLYSLHYGTLPVVHGVGGLADTVLDLDAVGSDQANGFCFQEPSDRGLSEVVDRALDCFQKPELWRQLQHNGMRADHSWTERAACYGQLYSEALTEHQRPRQT